MVRVHRPVVIAVVLLLGALSVAGVSSASGVSPRRAALPAPATLSQVLALVRQSSKIENVPPSLVPALQDVPEDSAANYYPVIKDQCSGTTQCVFGDTSSKTTVVLFGDSHAAMWLPALVYDADHLDFKVILVWFARCPAADVSVWDPSQHAIDEGCNTWRTQSISDIKKAAPSLILLSDRTTSMDGSAGKAIPDATWKAGMEKTISDFLSVKLKVALIGDITTLTNDPPACMAAHPTKIQDCSSPNPNKGFKTHVADEKAAAKAEGVPYIDPQSWLCTKKCSPVVGTYDVYYDNGHASATYAAFLALLFESAIKPLLPTG